MDLHARLINIRDSLTTVIEEELGRVSQPLFTDRINEMPVNLSPHHPDIAKRNWVGWPSPHPSEISGITIHHTMSHSPISTARYCTSTKGLPTIQYHFWVSANDTCDIWQLVPLDQALWHDHTGVFQTTLSIGLAGTLHVTPPPVPQLKAAARLVAWLMHEHDIEANQVQGHCDRAAVSNIDTVCPGWDTAKWKDQWLLELQYALLMRGPGQ